MINVGVIGYGYWGPNIVRNFESIDGVKVRIICDKDKNSLRRARKDHPHLRVCQDDADVIKSTGLDAVAIVTPVSTHYRLAKAALENGKHIFVEKPFTSTVEEAEKLIQIASKKRLKIMVDHTFLFTGAVRKIKEMIDSHMLGDLYYYDSTRVNLGLFQHDVNVIWDLAPHDLSVMDHVIKERPAAIVAHGMDHFKRGFENIAYINIYFRNNMIAHFNVNWLSPVKVRTTLIGGEKKMLVWNDLEADEKIKVYDRGVHVKTKEGAYNLLSVDYRSGDIMVPMIERKEALERESEYFIDCIINNKAPINDGHAGLRVVKLLQAADLSLKRGGELIKI